MDTNTSTQSIAAAATACRVAHDAYHGGSCSLVARGHHSYSCSENRLGKPHLDHLLGTIEGLQKEVLRMRVSHDDKGCRVLSHICTIALPTLEPFDHFFLENLCMAQG